MSAYFSRELVGQVNSQMTSGCVVPHIISPKVMSYVERKTTQEIAEALSWAWRVEQC